MSGKDIAAAGQALTADGGSDGTLTVTSSAGFRVGSRGNVSSATVAGVEVIVTEITDATHIKVRILTPQKTNVNTPPTGDWVPRVNTISYGTSDMSAYALANTARIDCPAQLIWNEPTA